MQLFTLCARGFWVFCLLGACNATLASERNKVYKDKNLLSLPGVPEEPSRLSEPSNRTNSLSQSPNRSIERGGTPQSISVSVVRGEKEKHFHFSVDELAKLANKGPDKSTTSHKTELPVTRPVIVIDNEACVVGNELVENESASLINQEQHKPTTSIISANQVAKQAIAQENEVVGLRSDPTSNKPVDKPLRRCSLLHCLYVCCGMRTNV